MGWRICTAIKDGEDICASETKWFSIILHFSSLDKPKRRQVDTTYRIDGLIPPNYVVVINDQVKLSATEFWCILTTECLISNAFFKFYCKIQHLGKDQILVELTNHECLSVMMKAFIPPALNGILQAHDAVIKWKQFLRYWPFVRGIRRWRVNSSHKEQWRGN